LVNYAKNNQIISLDANQEYGRSNDLPVLNKQLLEAENDRKTRKQPSMPPRPGRGHLRWQREITNKPADAESKLADLRQKTRAADG